MKKRLFLSSLIIVLTLSLSGLVYAGIINAGKSLDERWKHEQAYRPNPVLFLHGFAAGDPKKTWREKDVDGKLNEYFKNYFSIGPILVNPSPYEQSRYSYLELMSFIDFAQLWRSQLIDRNSSVDTYQVGDYYISTGERTAGDPTHSPPIPPSPGWSDKLNNAIEQIRQNYKDKSGKSLKIILVCHSMGGLAAREYLTNPKYSYAPSEIEKLILIGVPNLGSSFATLARGMSIAKTQHVGWFMPGLGWVSSSRIEEIDRMVEMSKLIDIDGDAERDMDPSLSGSGFLNMLNTRPQPVDIDYFVLWGSGRNLTSVLANWLLHRGEGDGVVSKDSQLGTGLLTLKDFAEIKTDHGNEPAVAVNDTSEDPFNPKNHILKFLDYTKPEVTITSPDPNADPIPVINTLSLNVKGAVSKEYLPADSVLKIDAKREEDGETKTLLEGKYLYPSDQWNPDDPNSIIAEFDEKIEFDKPGTYIISVIVTNPAGIASGVKTTRVKVILQKPIISIISPADMVRIADRRPLIKARIYSPDNISIDLSSIQLKLDTAVVTHVVTPTTGGPDVTISYTPTNDLSINNPDTADINEGNHTVVINAKDTGGLAAQEKTSTFKILPYCPRKIVELMRAINQRQAIVGINQTVFYNYMPGRNPYKMSLGNPDGGNNIPALDALDNYMYIETYIIDLRESVKTLLLRSGNWGRYWNNAAQKPWTLSALYQAAMGTTGTGLGKDSWTNYSSGMYTNGIETIDLVELQKCIEKLDTPLISLNNKQHQKYYYLRKYSDYYPAYGRYGSYNDCQNATPDTKDWSGGGDACGQLSYLAGGVGVPTSKYWYIGRYYWSFDTSLLGGSNVISAKLKWQRSHPLTSNKYYRHFTLNFRQTSFDAASARIPGDWGKGGTLIFSRYSATWNNEYLFIEEISPPFINTSGNTQFELTSSRDEAKDECPLPPELGEGVHEDITIYLSTIWDNESGTYVDRVYLIVTVTGLKN